MKAIKRIILLAVCIAVSLVANAQSEQWKAYLDICGQFRADMTPCEKMELYARMDSLFGGHMPDYNNLYNYMISSFLCGDTMTFKKQLVRATDWKCWNSKLIETWDAVDFLKKEKDWNQLDSLSKIYGTKKIYPYMDSLEVMVERDQTIRSELHNPNLSIEQKDSIFTQWQIIDSTNLTLLKSLIKRYGFPTWERVGYTGCRNAWLIAQHAIPYIYDFEKEYRKAVMDNNATKNLLAYLEDRSRTMRGLPQLYGTQLATNPKDYLPISDIKNVNSRREEIGLEPLNDYLKRMSIDINDYYILQDTSEPNYIDFYYKGNKLEPWGVIKAQGYLDENEFDKASVLYCHVFHNTYPFIRDLKRFVSTLIMNGGKSDQYLFISTYEVLERMVLCGYEPDAWFDSLPDTLTVPLLADYANLRDEYLRYLNHEDDAELTAALASRADFEALLRSGKNYHRYELDAWNHAYPLLQKMTDELTKGDYEEFYALLWREVERGNLHAEDYASLYDHTYYRLYGKDWYGILAATNKHVRTAKPKTLNDRRRAACLPLLSFAVTTSAQTPTYKAYRKYSLNLRIDGDTLQVSGFYLIPDTTSSGQPIKVDTTYSLPLADYRTADGAIVLRREGDWYPHKNGELLTAQVHIKADDYHIIGGTESVRGTVRSTTVAVEVPSFDIHLVLLPKDKYARKVIDSPTRPFHFYRLASDTTQYPEAYYREFIDSYNFYCSFFGDSLSSKPMNIVEIGDPQFVMCQGLRDMIIFGHYFYDVYTMIPDFSWIPHEVAHQWWGDGIFFEYRDYALSESLTEYIKLQYLKSRGRGYEEQIEYYKTMMERAEKTLPIADIHSVESQDESIAIYHAAPYRLTLEDTATVSTALQQLYHNHKHTIVSQDRFLQECKALQDWLKSE